jgi:hypothetical protein
MIYSLDCSAYFQPCISVHDLSLLLVSQRRLKREAMSLSFVWQIDTKCKGIHDVLT